MEIDREGRGGGGEVVIDYAASVLVVGRVGEG